ncbi:MAG: (d)CMP kinase [Coriobacteriales bacterium]|jgi:cytidylate kinase|nr:(d)CMP kinase [Coriobacteriales bacterium]
MILAIDGPAGSGKSTVAKLVARELGFAYLDTGAMYRSVAWRALAEHLDLSEPLPAASVDRFREIARVEPIEFGFTPGDPLPSRVAINGEDVTVQIRTPAVDKAVSPVSADPGVREALTEQQRVFGRAHNTVMEGRDIGTVVFPAAELKVFLTASVEERARRRALQNAEKAGRDTVSEEEIAVILTDLQRRDRYDSSREVAPLAPAPDSWELDSTGMTIEEVVAAIVGRANATHGAFADEQDVDKDRAR